MKEYEIAPITSGLRWGAVCYLYPSSFDFLGVRI